MEREVDGSEVLNETAKPGPVSMVLLLRVFHQYGEDELQRLAERAWRRDFSGRADTMYFVVQSGRSTIMKVGPYVLSLLHQAKPYFELSEQQIVEFLPDPVQREAWRAHTAWVAVDCMNRSEDIDLEYCVVARLVREMLSDQCTGIYMPLEQSFIPDDGKLKEMMQAIAESRDSLTV